MSAPSFGPFAAHVLLIAVVYGSLLLVIYVAFRAGRRSPRPATAAPQDVDDEGRALLGPEAADDEEAAATAANLPPLPGLTPSGLGDEGDDDLMRPAGGAAGAAFRSDPLDRISAQLDYALASPSVYPAKPREMIQAAARASPFGAQAMRIQEADETDRDVAREQMRRQEVVRKREAAKAAAAEAILQSRTGGNRGPPPQAAPAVHVAAAPLDAVYGAEPTNPAPEAAGPSASLPMSPEERILAMHIRGRG